MQWYPILGSRPRRALGGTPKSNLQQLAWVCNHVKACASVRQCVAPRTYPSTWPEHAGLHQASDPDSTPVPASLCSSCFGQVNHTPTQPWHPPHACLQAAVWEKGGRVPRSAALVPRFMRALTSFVRPLCMAGAWSGTPRGRCGLSAGRSSMGVWLPVRPGLGLRWCVDCKF